MRRWGDEAIGRRSAYWIMDGFAYWILDGFAYWLMDALRAKGRRSAYGILDGCAYWIMDAQRANGRLRLLGNGRPAG